MENVRKYIAQFFDELEVWEDINHAQSYKNTIETSIVSFMQNPNTDTAFDVYESFFGAYKIGTQDETNYFIELLEKMKKFEENSGRLLSKQRDHYLHSVYVFILGICIFQMNDLYRKAFSTNLAESGYKNFYSTKNEEFFYRWGNASLFHDIAYPLEITIKQANKYLEFISSYSDDTHNDKLKARVDFTNFDNFLKLPVLKPGAEYEENFMKEYPDFYEKVENAIDILSNSLSRSFNLDYTQMRHALLDFNKHMHLNSFIDHGYYSAIVVLRWYHYLINKTDWNPAYFYYPIVNTASAILLHNYYKHGLMKEPFNLGIMNVESHPLAYLLILCDELQEWDRVGYGESDQNEIKICSFDIYSDDFIRVKYKIALGSSPDQSSAERISEFIMKKKTGLKKLLNISSLLGENFDIEWCMEE